MCVGPFAQCRVTKGSRGDEPTHLSIFLKLQSDDYLSQQPSERAKACKLQHCLSGATTPGNRYQLNGPVGFYLERNAFDAVFEHSKYYFSIFSMVALQTVKG